MAVHVRHPILLAAAPRRPGAWTFGLLFFLESVARATLVTVLPEGVAPELSRVQNTDVAEIGVFEDRFTDRTIVVCAEDNLGKGAAGQAIQNVNRAFGFAETDGLRLTGVLV